MKFGMFYEHQLPRPWQDGRELQLFQEALELSEVRAYGRNIAEAAAYGR